MQSFGMRFFGDDSAEQLLGAMRFDFAIGEVYSEAPDRQFGGAYLSEQANVSNHSLSRSEPTSLQFLQISNLTLNPNTLNMVAQTSKPSSRSSSVTAPVERSSSPSMHHALATSSSLKSMLKKPFQGWSKDLLRARDDDDDDYNFSSGMRRGAQYYQNGA